jgi:serine/threonine protein kinase
VTGRDRRIVRRGTWLAPGYRVLGHMSRGNRLDVYDGWSVERDSRCVLKTLRPDRADEPSARRALLLEGRLLRRLTHPHLVRAYDIASAPDGRPVLVLETLGGETLSHLLHRLRDAGQRIAPAEVAELGRQLCSVVGYLHRQGVLHRDIKPGNIVADGGRAKLIDLSLVRKPGRCRAGAGTFEYMAPEQARGGPVTAAADVWGIGAVLFAALADQPPFGYADWTDDVGGAIDDPGYPQLARRAPLLAQVHHVPQELALLVDSCLEPEPTARPAVAELTAGFSAWLAGIGTRA